MNENRVISYIEEYANELGFTNPHSGVFYYTDSTGSVSYRKVNTDYGDRLECLAVFTGAPESDLDEQDFISFVSKHYKFEGNDRIRESIISSLNEGNIQLKEERIYMGDKYSFMSSEYVLGNPKTTPQQDDIYPMITIMNSYDGKYAKSMIFGLSIYKNSDYYSIRFSNTHRFGKFRQIHSRGARTFAISTVASYVDQFNESMDSIIDSSVNKRYTSDEITNTIAMLEDFGKRRSSKMSEEIQDLLREKGSLTTWDMFILIAKYASQVKSINIKNMMENLAETILFMPVEMANL